MMWRGREAHAFANAFNGESLASKQVADLVATAEAICQAAAAIQPSPAFRSAVRTSLVAEAATVVTLVPPTRAGLSHRRPTPLRARLRLRTATLTAVAVPMFGLLGLGTASASALPGDTLYPVKRGIENTELALQRGDSDRGTFQLKLATERLEETNGLTTRRAVPDSLAADTLATYSAQAQEGSAALARSFKVGSNREDIVTINRFASTAYRGLASLEGKLDGPAAAALASAQKQLPAIVAQSTRLCSDCGGINADLVSAILAPPGGDPAAPPAAPEPSDPAAAASPGAPATSTAESKSESESGSESESTSEDDSEESPQESSSDNESAPVADEPEPDEPESDSSDSDDKPSHQDDGHGKDADHPDRGKGNG